MRKIKLAFYKNSKTRFGKLIQIQQRLQGFEKKHWQYSHVEIVFCDLTTKEAQRIGNVAEDRYFSEIGEKNKNNIFFSSSEQDGGVRFKKINQKKENWDFVEIEVTEEQYTIMLNEAIRLQGRNYGWAGIFFAQGCNFNIKNSFVHRLYFKIFTRLFGYFCSEIVTKVLNKGIGNKFSQIMYNNYEVFINPAKFAKRIFQIFGKRLS